MLTRFFHRNREADEALFVAADRGDLQEVERQLARGARINFNKKGRMIERGWYSCGLGDMTGFRAEVGGTALMRAAGKGHAEIVELLLTRGAKPDLKENVFGGTALIDAATSGHLGVVKSLLLAGADPNIFCLYGFSIQTPLTEAVEYRHSEIALMLLDWGANPNVVGFLGVTPLMNAISHGMPDVVRCLLQAGADVTAPREGGCGALYIAIIGDDVEAVKLLLAEGADPNLGTTFHSLLSVARTRGNPSIIDLLSKAGARE